MTNSKTALFAVTFTCLAACSRSNDEEVLGHNEQGSTVNPIRFEGTGTSPAPGAAALAPRSPLEEFEWALSRLSPGDLISFGDRVRELLQSHPEDAAAFLEAYSQRLLEHKPEAAITYALQHSVFIPDGKGEKIAAWLLQSWNDTDTGTLQTYLHKLAAHDGGTEQECHRALKLLMQGEDGNFSSGQWITWISQLTKGQDEKGELQGAALNAMLSLIDPGDPEQIDTITRAYQQRMQDPGLQKHLPEFGGLIARHRPGEAERLLAGMPGGHYRQDTLQRVIAELGRSHPEDAAQWLSSQDVMERIFRPEFDDWKDNAIEQGLDGVAIKGAETAFQNHIDSVFDSALETYIFNIIDQHPEDAVANVASITDSNRREDLLKRIHAIIDTFDKEE